MFKNALVSVSDKTGLIDFLKPYVAAGMRVVSTGGTGAYLKEHGIPVVDVSEQTGFPEVMGGRVKTLHPRIHMALLARPEHQEDTLLLEEQGLNPFDLVIGNLYPFSEKLGEGLSEFNQIEFIDVGGPSFLRAAAKNFQTTTVVCDPRDYGWIAGKLNLSLDERRTLASKVYAHTAAYDKVVSDYLSGKKDAGSNFELKGSPVAQLRYGENPHQQATWYSQGSGMQDSCEDHGLHRAQVLQGKELSYNNLLDLSASVNVLRDLNSFGLTACVAVKHNNPCGVALDPKGEAAVERALQADPVSVFGGIVAVNKEVTGAMAKKLQTLFLECVVAPDFSAEAREIFSSKKNLRLLSWPQMLVREGHPLIRSLPGGFVVQTPDTVGEWGSSWQVLTDQGLDDKLRVELLFAWKVAAHLKSNSIAIVGEGQSLGLGMGQVNRVDAVDQAISRFQRFHSGFSGRAVLASDAFFPFSDSVERIAQAGISWVIQPGGALRDQEVLQKARELGVSMVLTGERHFAH